MNGRAPAPPERLLGQQGWPTLDDGGGTLLLVPVGSTEQHGPHLPTGTDAIIAAAAARSVAARLAAAGRRVTVAPTVAYGASGEHEEFPGTVSIGHDALYLILVELARSACRWAQGLVFVNGHGGNVPTLVRATELLRYEGRPVAWTTCAIPGADAHAGHTETCLLRHLAPWTVLMERAEVGATEPVAELMPRMLARGVRAVSPNGVLGDPTGATAEEGARLFATLVGRLAAELTEIDVAGDGRLRAPARAGR